MKINSAIITGATGAIGSALVKKLLDSGAIVHAIVRPNSNRIKNLVKHENLFVYECDLSSLTYLKKFGIKADAFFHLGWEKTTLSGRDDVQAQLSNVIYSLTAVELAESANAKVFVGAGSQAEYGKVSSPLNCETPVNPTSGYGIAKYTAGKATALKCKSIGMRHCWARILSVYGKNDSESSLISYLIKTFKAGEDAQLTKCEQIWDYIYSEDVADALIAIAEHGVDGREYPIGSGKGEPLKDFVIKVKNVVNNSCNVNFGAREYYPHQPMYLVADITQLTLDTGFTPKTDFTTGIKKLIGEL